MKHVQILLSFSYFYTSCLSLTPSINPVYPKALTTFNLQIRDYPAVFALFSSSSCEHCKGLDQEIAKLAKQLHADARYQKSIQTAVVKCNLNEQTAALCADQGVMGYPTIKFYQRNALTLRYSSDLPRNSGAFLKYINENFKHVKPSHPEKPAAHQIKEYTYEVSGGELFQLIQKGVKLVLFCNRDTEDCLSFQTGIWRSIVQRLPKDIKIDNQVAEGAFVDCGLYSQLCHSYSSTKHPYILLLDNGQEITRFLAKAEAIVIDQILGSIKKRLLLLKEERKPKKPATKSASGDDASEMYAVTDETEFNQLAAQDDSGFVFVKFYAPWCGHCKKLEPSWAQLAKEMNGKDAKANPEFAKLDSFNSWPKISRVDCTQADLQPVCTKQAIKGYPTLKLFHNGVLVADFSGQRQLDFLKRWLLLQLVKADPLTKIVKYEGGVGEVTAANFKTFSEAKTPKTHSLLYFHTPWCENCKTAEPVWTELAEKASNSDLQMGKLDCTEHRAVCIEQGVQGYPAFLMYQHGRILGKYTGKRTIEGFTKFVSEFVSIESAPEADEEELCSMDKKEECADSEPKKEAEEAPEAPVQPEETNQKTTSVQAITSLDQISSTVPTFVKFFTDGCPHCKNVAQTWKLLSSVEFDFEVVIAEVNCDTHQELCKTQEIRGLPTLRLFINGEIADDYKGPRDLVNLSEFIENQVRIEVDETEEEVISTQPKDEL